MGHDNSNPCSSSPFMSIIFMFRESLVVVFDLFLKWLKISWKLFAVRIPMKHKKMIRCIYTYYKVACTLEISPLWFLSPIALGETVGLDTVDDNYLVS